MQLRHVFYIFSLGKSKKNINALGHEDLAPFLSAFFIKAPETHK